MATPLSGIKSPHARCHELRAVCRGSRSPSAGFIITEGDRLSLYIRGSYLNDLDSNNQEAWIGAIGASWKW